MGIEQFSSFGKKKTKIENNTNVVIGYTRVSSKEQLTNNSLNYQEEAIKEFASARKFNLLEIFGGTYESASGDFSRKEFTKLIQRVKGMKIKPYAILIYKMSRFSRTGGGAIGLASELVENLGVHLFEILTGRDTTTEQGKLEIYTNLIEARKENLTKLSQTIPGMIKHLEKGKWLGKVPRGYDLYGPKVRAIKMINQQQEIRINEEGKIIKQAWNWKLQGEKDFEIILKLKNIGFKISNQSLSKMWRTPFYCGVSASKMLDGRVVYGKWEKIVSEQDFLLVQEILKGNTQGYKHSSSDPNRPLNAFIRCY